MTVPHCPRCDSPASRTDGGFYVCMMGGHYWPINGQKPIVIKNIIGGKKTMTTPKSPSGKKGICSNCSREKFIADKYGHCNKCRNAVQGLEPDTPAYADALAAVKERLSAPRAKRNTVIMSEAEKRVFRKPDKKSSTPDKPMPSTKIKQLIEKDIATDLTIIMAMRKQRDYHATMVQKLTNAISALL